MNSQNIYSDLFHTLQDQFSIRANPEIARAQQNYMKSSMPYWGIKSADRKKITLALFGKYAPGYNAMYRNFVFTLFDLSQYREEWYSAVDYALRYQKFILSENIDLYLALIQKAQWWDVVDLVAANLIGPALKGSPLLEDFLNAWIFDENLWIRRTALLTQLHYKSETNFKLLGKLILHVAEEREFFIRKAIGWSLRQYSYSNPETVIGFVTKHKSSLSKLSFTEALKALKRRGLLA